MTDGLHFLAWAEQHRGELAVAEGAYRRALALYRDQLPPDHPYLEFTRRGLSEILRLGGRDTAPLR